METSVTSPRHVTRRRPFNVWSTVVIVALLGNQVLSSEYHDELWRDLRQNYTRHVAPVPEGGGPIVVHMSLALITIIDLIEPTEIVKASWLAVLDWTDYRLQWDPARYANITQLTIPGTELWLPDVGLFNGQDEDNSIMSFFDAKFRAQLRHNDTVIWFTAGVASTTCDLDATYFPFDDQNCFVHIECISACDDELKLEPGGGVYSINLDEYKENEQWTIVNTTVVNGTRLCASNLKFCFHLRRKPAFFVMNIVLPIMILSIMTLTVFWLPPDSGEKTELAITIVLAFTVFQLLVSEIIPRTSDTTPLLGIYVFCATLMSALSLIASVCVLCLMRRSVIKRPSRTLCRIMTVLARIFWVRHELSSSSSSDAYSHNHVQQGEGEGGCLEEENKLLTMSALGNKMLQHNDGVQLQQLSPTADNQPDIQKTTVNTHGGGGQSDDRRNDVVAMLERIRREVRAELKVLTRATRDKEEEDVATKEWAFIANVIDRMLFCIFFVGNVILLSAFIWHRPGELDTCGGAAVSLGGSSSSALDAGVSDVSIVNGTL